MVFIGFACGKLKRVPDAGLAWMNFFLLDVSLPTLLFGIMSAASMGTFASIVTLTSVMWLIQSGRLVFS
jgi:hypothetical protein